MRTFLTLVLLLAIACNPKEIGGGWGLDLTFLPYVDGNVYQCEVDELVHQGGVEYTREAELELCYDHGPLMLAAELVAAGLGDHASCRDTPRHLGPCTMICGNDDPAIGGCNAYQGCWCRDE